MGPVATGGGDGTSATGLADIKLRDRVNFPHGGAPATGQGCGKVTVVLVVEVKVIDHQLTYDLDLLSLKGIDPVEGPLCVTSVRGHFGGDTLFFSFGHR